MAATLKACDLEKKTTLVISGSGRDFEMSIATPIKAIRAKCLDCAAGSSNEVRLCTVKGCALHPYREGTKPFCQKRKLSEQTLARLRKGVPRRNAQEAAPTR